jgi:hypothetical protein
MAARCKTTAFDLKARNSIILLLCSSYQLQGVVIPKNFCGNKPEKLVSLEANFYRPSSGWALDVIIKAGVHDSLKVNGRMDIIFDEAIFRRLLHKPSI